MSGAVRHGVRVASFAVPAGFVGLFFLYPVAAVVWRGLGTDGWDALAGVLGSDHSRGVVWFTVAQAAA